MNRYEAWVNKETCTWANKFEFRRARKQGLGGRYGRAWLWRLEGCFNVKLG